MQKRVYAGHIVFCLIAHYSLGWRKCSLARESEPGKSDCLFETPRSLNVYIFNIYIPWVWAGCPPAMIPSQSWIILGIPTMALAWLNLGWKHSYDSNTRNWKMCGRNVSQDLSEESQWCLALWPQLVMSSILLKLINNASNLTKGNHDRDGVWIFDLKWHIFFTISNDLRFQTLNTVFNHISKGLEVCQKSTPLRVAFSPLLEMWLNTVFRVWYTTSQPRTKLRLICWFAFQTNRTFSYGTYV